MPKRTWNCASLPHRMARAPPTNGSSLPDGRRRRLRETRMQSSRRPRPRDWKRGIAIVRNRPSRTAPWSPKQRRDPGRSEHKGSRRIKGALRHQRYARAADGSHRLFPSEQGPVYATNCPSVHDLRARGRPHPAGRPHAWGLRGPRVKPSGDEVTLLGDVVAPVIDVQASAGAAARRAPVQRVLPLANVTTAPMHAALHIPASVTIRELDRGVA